MKVQPTFLRLVNLFLICILLVLGFFTAVSWISMPPAAIPEPLPMKKFTLPLSFQQEPEVVQTVGPPFLTLAKNDIKVTLPDLRNVLIYFGSTVRPDVSESAKIVQLGIRGSTIPTPVTVGEPVYLKYECKGNTGKWSFNADNRPTPIWIVVTPRENGAEVSLNMNDSDGNRVKDPAEFATFNVAQVNLPYAPQGANAFDVGGVRADGSLLIRQKCTWFGQDLFLQQLGDDSTRFAFDKERIDFLDPENSYCCYVGVGDSLVYVDGFWHEVTPGPDSRGLPLLIAKKIDDKAISFDLWDPSGKVRIPIELRRAIMQGNFAEKFDLKLVGARSKRDWIAELGGVRMLVRSDDWFIFRDGVWSKISTPEDLDDYIMGNLRGPLLVLEGSEKAGNEMYLVGRVYDTTRTQCVPLKISLFKSWEQAVPVEEEGDEDDEDDDDDDEDDDEDEDPDDDDSDDDEDDDDDLV